MVRSDGKLAWCLMVRYSVGQLARRWESDGEN